MTGTSLFSALEKVQQGEPCQGKSEALLALGLRALLAAIGSQEHYRKHYIAKGGTILRLRSNERLERLSTDLDLSGVELGNTTVADHFTFASEVGRSATQILRSAYSKGAADIEVTFDEDSLGRVHDESDPNTVTYGIEVSAILAPGKNPTVARGPAYKIDLTCDEYIDLSLIEDLKVESYGIPIDVRIYAPLQSIAEKMRAILQKRRHFERKQNSGNWVPRHLFDLVPLRKMVSDQELKLLPELFRKKCARRKIDVDAQTRTWLLDDRLLEVAKRKDAPRATAAWEILKSLTDFAHIPP